MARIECGDCTKMVTTTLLDHLEKEHPEIFDKFIKTEDKKYVVPTK